MSLAHASPSDRGESPLMSNNPFRNRIAQASPPVAAARPISTNPFLDYTDDPKQEASATVKTVPSGYADETAADFACLGLGEHPRSPTMGSPPMTRGAQQPENGVERPARPLRSLFPGHRPTTSDEERRRGADAARRRPELDIFADPPEAKGRFNRPRRNSDTSVMDRASALLDPDEARKQMERKRRESKRPATSRKTGRKLDLIDKLDVSIYGTGLFHHDGPFDACNPNRNRRRHRLAPIQAFPKDSENMKIGGSGPVNKKLDYDKYHGIGREAHTDYNESALVVDEDAAAFARPAIDRTTSFNATSRVEPIHADETAGLGTSTFLEGAPASRAAIQRRESELEQPSASAQGLSRTKSLAQKIRGVRPTRLYSPEGDRTPTSPLTGPSESTTNPFFKDYDKDYDRKGQQIAVHEDQLRATRARARAPSFPPHLAARVERPAVLERTLTTGSLEAAPENKPSGGLLGRMKSLKKGKPKGDRREPS